MVLLLLGATLLSLAMAVLSGSQLLYALECRSEEGGLKGRPPWGNPWLLLSVLLSGGRCWW